MIRPQRYFPWKIARQIFFGQIVFLLIVIGLVSGSLHYYVAHTFVNTIDLQGGVARFDDYLFWLMLTVFVGCFLFQALTTRHQVKPLGRLIQRARELRKFGAPTDPVLADPELLTEEPGEWYDLERLLDRIHGDLRARTEDLSREREELSALIGAVSDAILAVDRHGEPLFFNSQFALLFRTGKTKALSLSETFRVPEILEGYREVLKSGQMRIVTAAIHTSHHAYPRHFSISIAPLRAGESEPVYGALAIFHDVTELKQSEQIRIEFVGNASHELRTPLTSIKGYVETLREDLRTGRFDASSKFLDIIARNVDRLIFLVNDLLDLSTLESGSDVSKSIVSTAEITESALKQLEAKRSIKRQTIHIHSHADSLHADPRRVEQVLVNLIHNAIKYIPEGSRIDVYWDRTADATILRIKDQGPGIPPEHQARLFERFYRVDVGRSRDQGGTGLGLSIVKHIMIKHGGSVRLVSKPGEGAEFVCTFPD